MMSYGEIIRMIHAAGKDPVERDSLYHTVRRFEPDDPIFEQPVQGAVRGTQTLPRLVQLVGGGRA